MANLEEVVYDSFYTYAGMVIADRAIVDVRDCLKPSPRMLLYNQYRNKNFSNKPFIKSASLVGDALKTFYYHGDAACYDMYCRMAAPYAMRYPLNNFHGNYGTLEEGHPAAMRYTEMRLSKLSTDYLFNGLDHNAITEWRDNFDDTDKSPSCLPSIGYYNICNGSIGLGIGISSSIPQFNLKEVNRALIKLIENPECDFDEIYCAPDFATGGTITNASEVKESLRKGQGASCRIRSTITYDAKNHELIVSALPYGVYSKTVVKQIKDKILEDENYGIVNIYDNSADQAEIALELSKDVNPSIMIKKLYKDTSLENWFSINMIMLDQGRFPKVFGWKEACQAYIDHIRKCKTNELNYDYNVLFRRNHILDGLKIALAHIDEVVSLIRHSESAATAKKVLMDNYGLDEEQAKAILDMKLQRLANLEAIKINNEFEENVREMDRLNNILSSPIEINKLLVAALQEVADKFGDARRTQLTNSLLEEQEEIEEKEIVLSHNNTTIKMAKRETKDTIKTTNLGTIVFVTEEGKMYKVPVSTILELGNAKYTNLIKDSSPVVFVGDLSQVKQNVYWIFATKDGIVKKSKISEYNYEGRQGGKMLKLREGDKVIYSGVFASDKETCLLPNDISVRLEDVKVTGKAAIGTKLKGGKYE